MTSQDIREMTFEKAVFGGYDMATVDTFLDNVAAEFAAIQKENAALKGKLRVLVEKVEKRNFGMHAIFPAALRDIQVKGQQ